MEDLIGKVESERGTLERLGGKLPGFSGYLAKEKRRDADKLLRDSIVRRFDVQRRRIPEIQQQLLSGDGILFVDDLERAAVKLDGVTDRIRLAPRGYAGFFDTVKVKEDDLERLYRWDWQLIDEADKVAAAVDGVQAAVNANGDIGASIQNLISTLTAVNDLYSHREEVILGIAG